MAGQVDVYYWSLDNVTTLCTDQCFNETSSWAGDVGDACGGQTFTVSGALVPVDSVAMRYIEGLNLACLTSESVL